MKQKKKLWKSVLGIILSLALVLSPIPGSSITAHAFDAGDVVVASVNLKSDSDHKISTETPGVTSGTATLTTGTTPVLTLENFIYDGDCGEYNSASGFGIFCHNNAGTVKIKLIGTNSIKINATKDELLFGIYSDPNKGTSIEIEGPGSLEITNGPCNRDNVGIYCCKNLIISNGATVIARAGKSDGDRDSNGIRASGNITINDSTVSGIGGDTGSSESYGILGNITMSNSTIFGSGNYQGLTAYMLEISEGCNVTAIGGNKAMNTVKNAIPGTGWDNVEGTGTGVNIPINTSGQYVSTYKKVQFLSHEHSFSYSSSGAIITGTCANTDRKCPLTDNKVTLTIVKPARTTFDGTESAAATLSGLSDFNSATGKSVLESGITYVGRDGTTYPESATWPTAVGKYTAKITVEGHTATVDYEIGKAKLPTPTEADARQNLNISYPNETISAKTGYEVSSTDGTLTPVTDISSILNQTTPTVYVRRLPTDNNHVVSDFVAITLTARPVAPAGLTTQSSSQAAAEDGKLIGTTTAMEYSADNGATWKTATATETIVKAGTYLVRIKATDSAPAGRNVSVNVESLQIILNDNQKPTAKTELVATGRPQELVNAPAAHLPTGATEMQYALGDKGSVPTSGWSTDIPTATEEGTYYVWYKAIGDGQHVDSQPAYLEVTISTGEINVEVETKEDVPDTEVEGVDKNLAESLLTAQEKELVNNGQDAVLKLEITNIDNSVSETDKNLTEGKAKEESGNAIIGMYLDLSLFLQVGNEAKRSIKTTNGKDITVKSEIPQNLRAPSGVKRTFFIIHVHNGAARVIAKATGTVITFKTSEFSTFALAYIDESEDGFVTELKVTQKNGKIKLSWDKCEGAASYEVFATYCGKDFSKKPTKTTKNNSVTIKKLKGKKVDLTKNFKLYVVAYDASGKKIGRSVSAHVAGKDSKKFKNPKEVKLSTKTITLDKGKSSKITASVKMEKGNRIALSDDHTTKLRYVSTNKNVATVTKKGKVKAVGSGECKIYVFARNGLAKAVTVTVN